MTTSKLHKSRWYDIGSDVNWIDYGGKWARHIEGTRYHVIRFENCEEWGDGATGYHCDLSEVNILPGKQMYSAIQCCGLDDDLEAAKLPLNQVYALFSYGAYAPLHSASGHNAHSLIREAKRESKRLQRDSAAYEQAMDRPVNAIGSTAREYAAGDMLSGVLRGVADGDPKAELLLKLGVR